MCSFCKFIFYQNPAPASTAIISKNRSILLVKRKFEPAAGTWCLPGGFIEYGESPLEALKREVFEETGLDVNEAQLYEATGTCEHAISPITLIIYIVTETSGDIRPGDDATDAQFFSFDSLPEKIAFASHDKLIRQFISEQI